jgi:epsilon-lactone hydrolase
MSKEQLAALDSLLRRSPIVSPGQTVQERRAAFAALMELVGVPEGVRTEPATVGARPALIVTPEEAARPGTILYFHGGAWVVGSPRTALSLTAHLVVRTGVTSISVDYRLAPEDPVPAAIEDCLAAYRELLEGGTDPAAVVFAGDSAGGGLAVTTCLAAKAAGLPQPGGIVAFSAGLDATRSGESMRTKDGIDPMFTRAGLSGGLDVYAAGHDPGQELLSPATAGDLTGLPPMLLQVGTNELLLDDSTRLAERARDAGVSVILDVVAGAPHVFQIHTASLDEAAEALDRAALFITQRLRQKTA